MRLIRTSVKKRLISHSMAAGAFLLPFGFIALFGTMAHSSTRNREAVCLDIENMNSSGGGLHYEASASEPEKTSARDDEPDLPEDDVYENVEIKADIDSYLDTLNLKSSEDDLMSYTTHSGAIIEEHFGRCGGPGYIDLPDGGQVRNCTELSAETLEQESKVPGGITIERYSDEPQILIMHTHTSESYEPYEKSWYDAEYISRSPAPENGVIAVGEAISRELAAAGIHVIHDCTVYDDPYNGAYTRSLYGTAELLERYPSIKIVLDIHRDAIEYTDGTRVSAVTEIDGKKAAQIMVICAADDGNYDVPDYIDNFHFACELQQEAEMLFPTLTRPILFQYCQYNQQLSKGALLIEVGSHGNSAEQAVYSGELIGKTLVSLLTGEQPELSEAVPALSGVPLYFLGRVI